MGDARKTIWLLLGLGLLFLAAALTAPINHDESQYVAAIALMRDGLPYRDWPYLQTPLQPLLLSPLSLLPAGWLLVGARLANVLFALVTCWALLRLLKGKVPFRAAAIAVGSMATTNAFLFGTEVARNDMLPLALLSLGMLSLDRRRALMAGLCFGLAISAKISFAPPVAGAGLWLLWSERKLLPAALVGGLAGLLPCLILYALAPDQFVFGVFTYSLEAPQQFWTLVGEAERLTVGAKLADLGLETVKGASLVAMALWLATIRQGGAERRLLDLMILGGLAAAYLPDPFFRQYLIPLLPPLFTRAALGLPSLRGRGRQLTLGAGAITSAVGASGSLSNLAEALTSRPELLTAFDRARTVAAIAGGRPLITLSPEQFAGSDMRLHPGFAAGPFLFRTTGRLASAAEGLAGAPTFERLEGLAPGIIVTGGERKARPPLFPSGPDEALDRHAAKLGYQPVDLGDGWTLWTPRRTPK
jgi:hypothetical protein